MGSGYTTVESRLLLHHEQDMVTVLWDLHVVACVKGNAGVQCSRTYVLLQPVLGRSVVLWDLHVVACPRQCRGSVL